ncbi:MAG: ABC transporter permease [Campylobacterales bacterium]|nr:ABC transporter permease [Campylobacterales bacterium]
MINFAFKLLLNEKKKNIPLTFIFIIIVFLISSLIILTNSLNKITQLQLENQPDITIFNQKAGRNYPILTDIKDEISNIYGIKNIHERVYGFYKPNFHNLDMLIIGFEPFGINVDKNIEKIVTDVNLSSFLEKPSMIISHGLYEIFLQYSTFGYIDSFNFFLEDSTKFKLHINGIIDKNLDIVSDRLVLTNIEYAKKILGYHDSEATDISIDVSNIDEIDTIILKLKDKFPNFLIIKKSDLKDSFKELYSFKSGLLFAISLLLLSTFLLLTIFKSTSMDIKSIKEIAILKAIGWSINDILKLKLTEASIIAIFSFLTGFLSAILYLKYLHGAFLIDIFTNSININSNIKIQIFLDKFTFFSLFFLFVFSFILINIIIAYKSATTNIKEILN